MQDSHTAAPALPTFSAFDGHRRLATGTLVEAAVALAQAQRAEAVGPLLVFNDGTGAVVDVDARGSDPDIAERLAIGDVGPGASVESRGPGRPRLGVVGREITLLPQQWEWLGRQPGGASVTLRKLVEQAKRDGAAEEQRRLAREAAYRFLYAMAGNLPGFEEVSRALFAGDAGRMAALMADWPEDIRAYALKRLA
jgi:hypothetical protein